MLSGMIVWIGSSCSASGKRGVAAWWLWRVLFSFPGLLFRFLVALFQFLVADLPWFLVSGFWFVLSAFADRVPFLASCILDLCFYSS
jgi:hypothetical protein